ncbi:hypothetical protein [Sinorhizobium americanum]|uniref:Secreted protein n=1 Tax=Sinorhizobium americanum TaxID=194963 RepID=A0A4R2BR71_9HYPH|nr:hypothetical protein [Sinorhizobium americanum]TCN30148.1 hypothetical protein EV184_10814 [Sinorhizobium americanum]
MTQISRRIMLGGFAATAGAVVASAIPLPAPAAIVEPVMTPEERLQAAIEEVKAAASAMAPEISRWDCIWNPDGKCKLILASYDF